LRQIGTTGESRRGHGAIAPFPRYTTAV